MQFGVFITLINQGGSTHVYVHAPSHSLLTTYVAHCAVCFLFACAYCVCVRRSVYDQCGVLLRKIVDYSDVFDQPPPKQKKKRSARDDNEDGDDVQDGDEEKSSSSSDALKKKGRKRGRPAAARAPQRLQLEFAENFYAAYRKQGPMKVSSSMHRHHHHHRCAHLRSCSFIVVCVCVSVSQSMISSEGFFTLLQYIERAQTPPPLSRPSPSPSSNMSTSPASSPLRQQHQQHQTHMHASASSTPDSVHSFDTPLSHHQIGTLFNNSLSQRAILKQLISVLSTAQSSSLTFDMVDAYARLYPLLFRWLRRAMHLQMKKDKSEQPILLIIEALTHIAELCVACSSGVAVMTPLPLYRLMRYIDEALAPHQTASSSSSLPTAASSSSADAGHAHSAAHTSSSSPSSSSEKKNFFSSHYRIGSVWHASQPSRANADEEQIELQKRIRAHLLHRERYSIVVQLQALLSESANLHEEAAVCHACA